MYTLKSIAQRSTALGAVAALVVATIIPATATFADALNPLTERSLLLTSSAPGFHDTDGSGNSEAAPNAINQNYAPAGSGPNGKKTGQTFKFKTSTAPNSLVKGFSLQYCIEAAGWCAAPGNNPGDNRNDDRLDNTHADAHAAGKSDLDVVGDFVQGAPAGGFDVLVDGTPSEEDWVLTADNLEDTQHSEELTGKNNYLTITSETGETIPSGVPVQIVFRPSEDVYITNPGSGAFFVKINTYSSDTSLVGSHNDATRGDNTDAPGHTVIDGGVTVANVMTDSIHITTKVLETMAFSVGTQNPDTAPTADHGTCDAITVNDRLNLGNQNAEYSLETGTAYDVNSYWRLSSNSSGGATVYYSGNTLANTVGDEITQMGAAARASLPGTEQFGLAFVDATTDDTGSFNQAFLDLVATPPAGTNYRMPSLYILNPLAVYANGAGTINGESPSAQFAFLKSSLTEPVMIAQDNSDVISCDTAKMRYVANIGADTPAGVYTTKINYLAAPQY